MNVFRLLADLSHAASKITLIVAIHRNSSAEGVSLLTQLLYTLVFGTRYLDLFWVPPSWSWWNFLFKIFYIFTSIYVVYLMMRVYPRTREKETAWKITTWSLGACLLTSPLVTLVLSRFSFSELLWTFSIELESICVLPQLQLLRQTSVPTVLDSYYLVTLGSYRFFYILNWIWRAVTTKNGFEPIALIFGIIQTLLYIDFAWVYYSRQRVKLRGGGVVDSDDLSKSFLVRRFLGNHRRSQDNNEDITEEDEALARQENGTLRPSAPGRGTSWGARGISVSADDTLDQHQAIGSSDMADPAAFEDDYDEDAPSSPAKSQQTSSKPSANTEAVDDSAAHWADSTRKDHDDD